MWVVAIIEENVSEIIFIFEIKNKKTPPPNAFLFGLTLATKFEIKKTKSNFLFIVYKNFDAMNNAIVYVVMCIHEVFEFHYCFSQMFFK